MGLDNLSRVIFKDEDEKGIHVFCTDKRSIASLSHLIPPLWVQGAVFDLPEEIAKNLLTKEMPPGTTITKINKLPVLEDDGPASDFYGRFSNRERSSRGGGGSRREGSGGSRGWGNSRFSSGDEGDNFRRGGRSGSRGGGSSSWSSGGSRTGGSSKSGGSDWLIGDRRSSSSSSPSFGIRDRNLAGPCFHCGRSGHRESECPKKQDY